MEKSLKLPFGILRNETLVEKFSKNPKVAAKQFLESKIENCYLNEELEKYFPYKDFNSWISEFGVALTKLKLESISRDEEFMILAARTLEELNHEVSVLKNREKVLSNYSNYKFALENIEKLKEKVEEKVKEAVKVIAPNLSILLGPILAAGMIAKAKGLKNLSKMPSSKLQILGAEKSLFKYLEEKQKLPKYGMIYVSEYIQGAKKEDRGKVARLLSARIMVAARLDYFSEENRGEELRKNLLEEINNI